MRIYLSQSLRFLRAFQRIDEKIRGMEETWTSRNPFVSLGHFNSLVYYDGRE